MIYEETTSNKVSYCICTKSDEPKATLQAAKSMVIWFQRRFIFSSVFTIAAILVM